MQKAKYILYIVAILSIFLSFSGNSAFAEDVDYSVTIAPALTLTTTTNSLVLNLDPSSKTFESKTLTVSAGTNNKTGYTLTLSTPNDNTDLDRNSSVDSITATIPTLSSGTYTESTFTADRWGYKINSNTSIPSTITTDYIPFVSGNTLMESSTAINHDETELAFAAKIDYLQPSGSYSTTLQFNMVANPLVDYIQDFTATMCQEKASDANYTVVDKRDGQEYTVRYINGNCWMTQNLRYIGDTGSTSGSMVMKAATSNIDTDTTIAYADITVGTTYDAARLHVATSNQVPSGATYTALDMGVWYNYAVASAMSITGNSNTDTQTYDICPDGWRLPTYTEQRGITSYANAYNPITGGRYTGTSQELTTYGGWWSSTVYNASARYDLYWNTNLYMTFDYRGGGFYIRCIRST